MLSPKKYILTKARKLEFHECLINEDWTESGLATIFATRKMPSGNYLTGLYLTDVFCLGLKNTLYKFNQSEEEYEELCEQTGRSNQASFVEISPTEAHNIIYGAIDYAEELGFKPNKSFSVTEHILDPDLIDEGIDDIEFGKEGQPFFIQGPNDNVPRIMSKLTHAVGEDGFTFIANEGSFDEFV